MINSEKEVRTLDFDLDFRKEIKPLELLICKFKDDFRNMNYNNKNNTFSIKLIENFIDGQKAYIISNALNQKSPAFLRYTINNLNENIALDFKIYHKEGKITKGIITSNILNNEDISRDLYYNLFSSAFIDTKSSLCVIDLTLEKIKNYLNNDGLKYYDFSKESLNKSLKICQNAIETLNIISNKGYKDLYTYDIIKIIKTIINTIRNYTDKEFINLSCDFKEVFLDINKVAFTNSFVAFSSYILATIDKKSTANLFIEEENKNIKFLFKYKSKVPINSNDFKCLSKDISNSNYGIFLLEEFLKMNNSLLKINCKKINEKEFFNEISFKIEKNSSSTLILASFDKESEEHDINNVVKIYF